MFLIERLTGARGSGRSELFPQRFFPGSGDLVRAALQARPADTAAPGARRPASQLALALPAPAHRRKTG